MDVTLTDDEVVAIAAIEGGVWKGYLPTVDVTDEAQLLLSSVRGRRSMRARGWIDGVAWGTDTPFAQVGVRRSMGSLAVAVVHAGSMGDPTTALSPVLSIFASDEPDTTLVDLADASGLHQFVKQPVAQSQALISASVASALEDETATAARDGVGLLVFLPAEALVHFITRGAARAGRLEDDGTVSWENQVSTNVSVSLDTGINS